MTKTQAEFESKIQAALCLKLDYEERSLKMPAREKKATPAAVLVLFGYSNQEENPEKSAHILLTRRTESVETHKGQMAFPGGRSELEDDHECHQELRGAIMTALRETEEEVGIPKSEVRILGRLPLLMTVTDYLIAPIVGVLTQPIESIALELDSIETAEAIWIPYSVLSDPNTYRRELIAVGAVKYPIHVYQVKEHRIWGATGSMMKNLLDRLASVT
jgi:8-oxo-dGTP pyrophosphatase MutT (NUDIX family)